MVANLPAPVTPPAADGASRPELHVLPELIELPQLTQLPETPRSHREGFDRAPRRSFGRLNISFRAKEDTGAGGTAAALIYRDHVIRKFGGQSEVYKDLNIILKVYEL